MSQAAAYIRGGSGENCEQVSVDTEVCLHRTWAVWGGVTGLCLGELHRETWPMHGGQLQIRGCSTWPFPVPGEFFCQAQGQPWPQREGDPGLTPLQAGCDLLPGNTRAKLLNLNSPWRKPSESAIFEVVTEPCTPGRPASPTAEQKGPPIFPPRQLEAWQGQQVCISEECEPVTACT